MARARRFPDTPTRCSTWPSTRVPAGMTMRSQAKTGSTSTASTCWPTRRTITRRSSATRRGVPSSTTSLSDPSCGWADAGEPAQSAAATTATAVPASARNDRCTRARVTLGPLRQLELIVFDDTDARRVILVADVAFERSGFTKVNALLECARRCLDGCTGGEDLDTVHRDARRDLLIKRLTDGGRRGNH